MTRASHRLYLWLSELTDFALFLEVAQQGSFSRAAGTLRLAQPSVSARMAGLERSVGQELFARSTRGVTLTAAGPGARALRAAVPRPGRGGTAIGPRIGRFAAARHGVPAVAGRHDLPGADLRPGGRSRSTVTAGPRTAARCWNRSLDATAHIGFVLGTSVPGGLIARAPVPGADRRCRAPGPPRRCGDDRCASATWPGTA